MAKRCKAKTVKGGACRAYAIEGSDYCFQHDTSARTKRKRDESRKMGGRARKYKQIDPPGEVSTLEDVLRGINAVLMRAWARDNSEKNDRILLAAYAAAEGLLRPNELEEAVQEMKDVLINKGLMNEH